jgi:5-formyltetrahydrofolate cyclo-ligase
MDLKAQKVLMRREVIARIMAMNSVDRQSQESELARRFEELPGVAEARTVLLYVSAFPEEFDTRPLLLRTLEQGKRLVLPKVDRPSKTLHLYEVAQLESDLQPGHRGIPEPSGACLRVEPLAIDWVLVPGLAFNSQGYRLGRGAGHYDKLLLTLRPDAPKWALILGAQWLEDLPIEPHDQPLDGVADFRQQIQRDRHSTVTLGRAS